MEQDVRTPRDQTEQEREWLLRESQELLSRLRGSEPVTEEERAEIRARFAKLRQALVTLHERQQQENAHTNSRLGGRNDFVENE
jgi:hypothetical protein